MSSNSFNCLINSDDFCLKEANKKCMAHDCGSKYCSYEKESCKHLMTWGIMIKTRIKEPKVYTRFIESIKHCKKINYINQWAHRMHFG